MINRFGLDYPGHLVTRHPRWAILVLVVAFLATLFAIPKLRFDDNTARMFSANSSYSKAYSEFISDLGSEPQDVIILVEGTKSFSEADYRKMRQLTLELQLLDQVKSVLSPFSAKFPKNHLRYPGQSVFPEKIENKQLAERLATYKRGTRQIMPMITDDSRYAFVIVSVSAEKVADKARPFLDGIKATTKMFSTKNTTYTIAGQYPIAFNIVDSVKRDLIILNVLGSLLAAFLALIIFRGLRNTVVALVPAIASVIVTFSIFVWLDYPITVISNFIPILVLVLGIADSIHLTMYLRDSSAGDKIQDRITNTISDISPACALTSITTAIAFASIAVSKNEQLFEFAILGSVAMIAAHVVVIVVFVLIAPIADLTSGRTGIVTWMRVPKFVSHSGTRFDQAIIAGFILIALTASWGFSRTEAWFTIDQNLPEKSDIRRANNILQDKFGGIYRIWVELDTTGNNSLATQNGWLRLLKMKKAIESAAPNLQTFSLINIADWLDKPNAAPTTQQMENVPPYLKDQLITPGKKIARILIFVPEPMRSYATLDTHDRIVKFAKAHGAKRVTGIPVVLRQEAISIVVQLSWSLLIAAVVAVITTGIVFGWPALSFILIVPNLLPLLITACAVHILSNGQMDPVAVLTLTIAFGIAIDDSIHLINMYQLRRFRDDNIDVAMRYAIEKTGPVMIATTLLISAGMIVTLVSDFSTVRLFGKLMILALLAALIIDLLLLPALVRHKWFRR